MHNLQFHDFEAQKIAMNFNAFCEFHKKSSFPAVRH